MRILVVGASLAGVRTVRALRRRGCDAAITLVAGEPDSPTGLAADRPPLSKTFLTEEAAVADPLATPDELAGIDVEVVTGRAIDLDLGRRRVLLHGGRPLEFDRLVIATGSTPRTVPELEPRAGVHVLRTASDAAAIRSACVDRARVVVVGGGFIGAEVAWSVHQLGCPIAVVEPLPALMMRGLGPELGAAMTRRHAAAGIELRLGAGVAAIEGLAGVDGVRLTDGTRLRADVVVLGLGTVPETGWLQGSGLDLRDGVVCDERLTARGVDGVYAVGDVARWHHPRYGEDVRVEHWTNAVESANVVAANITGTPTAHEALPYVWSDQLGARLQIFGRVRPQDRVEIVHGDVEGSFVALCGGDGLLQGAVGLGAMSRLMPYRKLLLAGASWDEALG